MMSEKKRIPLIDFNSPVILSLFFISLIALVINSITGGMINRLLACYFTGWSDPLMYPRLFSHVLAHQDLSHFTGNYLFMLAVGPMVEEKYGSGNLAKMAFITSGATGLINVMFFRSGLVGASGLLFMLIILASFTNIREGRLPLTVLLVGFLYVGNEIIRGLFSNDNISQISHIAGAICGAVFGFDFHIRRNYV
jgi:membrane associated rhomboid family serine protease